MKHIVKRLWIVIAILCLSISASAYDFVIDGLKYTVLSEEDRTVEVTMPVSRDVREVNIPARVINNSKTYKVTRIGSEAFRGCSGLTSLTIPN